MKFKSMGVLALLHALCLISSCSGEPLDEPNKDEPNTATNSLVNCSQIVVNGSYRSETALGNNEQITIKVNVVETGSYQISTNTVNGYSFSDSGSFSTLGVQDVQLIGSGTPGMAQTDTFSVNYGNLECSYDINVVVKEIAAPNKIIVSCGKPHLSDDYYVYAVDGNGNLLWSKLGFGETVAIADDVTYLNISGHLYAVNINTGDQIWSNETLEGSFHGAVTLSDNTLYSSSNNGKVHALDASNGEIKWSFQTEVSAVMSSVPTEENDVVYFGAPDDHVYALDISGNLKWKYKTGATDVRSSPAIVNDKVYVGADDGKLYVLDASNGALAWDFDAGISGQYSPTISNDKVYVQSSQAVFCLDVANGSEVWNYTLPSTISDWSSPTEHNNILYVCGTNNGLQAFDAMDGSTLWKNTSFGTATNGSPTLFDGFVYLAAPGGLVAIDASSGETLWVYGEYDPWNASNIKSFYTSPVVYDIETKTVGYPSDSGNKQ